MMSAARWNYSLFAHKPSVCVCVSPIFITHKKNKNKNFSTNQKKKQCQIKTKQNRKKNSLQCTDFFSVYIHDDYLCFIIRIKKKQQQR